VFCLNPVMILEGNPGFFQVVLIAITSLVGIFGVSACLEGYGITNMNWIQRILSAGAGLLLIDPNPITDVVGVGILALVLLWQFFQIKKNKAISA